MIDAAVASLQRRGAAGASFTEILQASGAARGAIYHHFPGGKAQLLAEAAQRQGDGVQAVLADLAPARSSTPADVVAAFLEAVRPVLAGSAEGSGCAVAAATVEAQDAGSPHLRQIADRAFDAWVAALADRLTTAGLPGNQAQDVATTLVTLLEGAHVLCRAAGNTEPFERVARTSARLIST
jgi:AcrR family transcriptional regulator